MEIGGTMTVSYVLSRMSLDMDVVEMDFGSTVHTYHSRHRCTEDPPAFCLPISILQPCIISFAACYLRLDYTRKPPKFHEAYNAVGVNI